MILEPQKSNISFSMQCPFLSQILHRKCRWTKLFFLRLWRASIWWQKRTLWSNEWTNNRCLEHGQTSSVGCVLSVCHTDCVDKIAVITYSRFLWTFMLLLQLSVEYTECTYSANVKSIANLQDKTCTFKFSYGWLNRGNGLSHFSERQNQSGAFAWSETEHRTSCPSI